MKEQPNAELVHFLHGRLKHKRHQLRIHFVQIVAAALLNAICVIHIATNFRLLVGALLPGPLGARNVPDTPMALSLLFAMASVYGAAHFLKRWICAFDQTHQDCKQLQIEYEQCFAAKGDLSIAALEHQQGELTQSIQPGQLTERS